MLTFFFILCSSYQCAHTVISASTNTTDKFPGLQLSRCHWMAPSGNHRLESGASWRCESDRCACRLRGARDASCMQFVHWIEHSSMHSPSGIGTPNEL